MYKNVLQNITGIEIYPIISLILFFTVFTAMLLWTRSRKKEYLDAMAVLPLDSSDVSSSTKSISIEAKA